MINGFDRIAFIYDFLADVAFFGRIFKAQIWFINKTTFKGNVLVIGGGTGRILKPLLKNCVDAKIFFLDASGEMIRRSKARTNDPAVVFIHGTEESLPIDVTFDYIIVPFFLDLFQEPDLSGIIDKLKVSSAKGSNWLVTDFVNHTWWQRLATNLMYRFFKWTSGVTPSKLESWEDCLVRNGLISVRSKAFFFGFIRAYKYKV